MTVGAKRLSGLQLDESQTLDALLHQVLNHALVRIGAAAGSLMLVDRTEGILQLKARLGPPSINRRSEPVFKVGSESVAGYVAETRQAYYCPDVDDDDKFSPSRSGRSFASLLCVPIVHDGNVIAVINADSPQRDWFSPDRQAELQRVADSVAAVLAQRVGVLDALLEISKRLARMPRHGGVDAVLQSIVDHATNALGADVVTLYQYDQSRREFLVEGRGPTVGGVLRHPEAMQTRVFPDDVPYRIVEGGEAHFLPSVESQPFLREAIERKGTPSRARFIEREGVKSMAALLLLHGANQPVDEGGEEVVGVMFVNYRNEHDFNIDERRTLGTFADFAAIAIVNARNEASHVHVAKQIVEAVSGSLAHRMSRLFGASKVALENLRCAISAEALDAHADLDIIKLQADQLFGLAERLKQRVSAAGEQSEKVSLQATIQGVLTDIKREPDGNDVHIDDLTQGRADLVYSDSVHLRQIVYDIIRNSIESLEEKRQQYVRKGLRFQPMIELRVQDSELDITELEVRDNGVGIGLDLQGRLFLPATSTKGSLGIGLWWCRTFVRATGGDLLLKESSPDQGCSFVLRLPKAQPPPIPAKGSGRAQMPAEEEQQPSILIVEDDETLAKQLSRYIRNHGHFRIETVHSYEKAVEFLSSPARFDLLMLDISLDDSRGSEDEGGLRLLELVKQRRLGSKILFMTGHGDRHPMDRIVAAEPLVLAWFNKTSADWPSACIGAIRKALQEGRRP